MQWFDISHLKHICQNYAVMFLLKCLIKSVILIFKACREIFLRKSLKLPPCLGIYNFLNIIKCSLFWKKTNFISSIIKLKALCLYRLFVKIWNKNVCNKSVSNQSRGKPDWIPAYLSHVNQRTLVFCQFSLVHFHSPQTGNGIKHIVRLYLFIQK